MLKSTTKIGIAVSLVLILLFLAIAFPVQAWWDTDYGHSSEIYSNATNSPHYPAIPISVNDTFLFKNETIWVWNATAGENIYVYCKVSGCAIGDVAVANKTDEVAWENETTGTGNNLAKLWENASIVYHFNKTGDTTEYDSSPNDYHGTLTNGPTEVLGLFGWGINLATVNDMVVVSSSAGEVENGSMSIWFKPDSTMNSTEGIASTGGGERLYRSTVVNQWDVYFREAGVAEDGKITHTGIIGNGSNFWTATNSWSKDIWHHLVYTWNGSWVRVYVNGVIDNEVTRQKGGDIYPINFKDFQIGYRGVSWGGFTGLIDEFRVWTRPLTGAEVQSIYYNGIDNLTSLGAERAVKIKSYNYTEDTGVDRWAWNVTYDTGHLIPFSPGNIISKGTIFTSSNYAKVGTSDDNRVQTLINRTGTFLYEINIAIDKSDIEKIEWLTEVLVDNGATFKYSKGFLWNFSSGSWVTLYDSVTDTVETIHTGSTTNLDYIADNGTLYFATHTTGLFGDYTSRLFNDYVRFNITYTTLPPVGDTCDTCEMDCSENCTVDSNLDCSAGKLTFTGAGTIAVQAEITNWAGLAQIDATGGCDVICDTSAGCDLF